MKGGKLYIAAEWQIGSIMGVVTEGGPPPHQNRKYSHFPTILRQWIPLLCIKPPEHFSYYDNSPPEILLR